MDEKHFTKTKFGGPATSIGHVIDDRDVDDKNGHRDSFGLFLYFENNFVTNKYFFFQLKIDAQ